MRTTRTDLEGRPRYYAIISRKRDSELIDVQVLTPDAPGGRVHHVRADCVEDIQSMAQCLLFHLDGRRGTNSDTFENWNVSPIDPPPPPRRSPMSDASNLIDTIIDNLSPEAVALIAAKCQPVYARGETGQGAERECGWFAQQLIDALGQEEYKRNCEDLKI